MSTYPPRECGIATFTKDLSNAFEKYASKKMSSKIIALTNDHFKKLKYPRKVVYKINEADLDEYKAVAERINKNPRVKVVNIQHEFGIYGGIYLNNLAAFMEIVKKPVVTTLHSILPDPPECMRSTVQYLAKKSIKIIAPTLIGAKILNRDYRIPKSKIKIIPHGIHDIPFESSEIEKKKLGYGKNLIISTFGLISGGKNYEHIIRALPAIVSRFPNVKFLIIGQTHPGILKDEGEKYRNQIKKLIYRLNLEEHVEFVNKYLSLEELLRYLRASDIFVSSGKGHAQIVSGTLSYAMGSGKPVVTIPILHAREAVKQNRGFLVKIDDSEAMAKSVITLLENPELRKEMGKNAYEYTRFMTWKNVAKEYMKVFRSAS